MSYRRAVHRRRFLLISLSGVLAAPLGTKITRIGFLSPTSAFDAGGHPSDLAVLFGALRDGLREAGYV